MVKYIVQDRGKSSRQVDDTINNTETENGSTTKGILHSHHHNTSKMNNRKRSRRFIHLYVSSFYEKRAFTLCLMVIFIFSLQSLIRILALQPSSYSSPRYSLVFDDNERSSSLTRNPVAASSSRSLTSRTRMKVTSTGFSSAYLSCPIHTSSLSFTSKFRSLMPKQNINQKELKNFQSIVKQGDDNNLPIKTLTTSYHHHYQYHHSQQKSLLLRKGGKQLDFGPESQWVSFENRKEQNKKIIKKNKISNKEKIQTFFHLIKLSLIERIKKLKVLKTMIFSKIITPVALYVTLFFIQSTSSFANVNTQGDLGSFIKDKQDSPLVKVVDSRKTTSDKRITSSQSSSSSSPHAVKISRTHSGRRQQRLTYASVTTATNTNNNNNNNNIISDIGAAIFENQKPPRHTSSLARNALSRREKEANQKDSQLFSLFKSKTNKNANFKSTNQNTKNQERTKKGVTSKMNSSKETFQQKFMRKLTKGITTTSAKFRHAFSGASLDTLILLTTTALVIPLTKRLGSSSILGFLATGMLLGPNGLALVKDIKTTEAFAELGIVFFLFEMGLELSVERLLSMKRDVFGLGLFQFSLTTGLLYLISHYFFKLSAAASIVVGGALALSSSAFVLQLLRDDAALGTRQGKASFGVLLLQDLAVVPLLVILPLLASGGSMAWAVSWAAFKAFAAVSLIILVGKFALDRVFNFVAKSESHEAFISVILVTVLTMSNLTEGLGLSNTLGAFMAGIVLSETKYRYQVEADIAPFRGLLLGLFFMTVGFEIDMAFICSRFPQVASLVLLLLTVKTSIITGLGMANGLRFSTAQRVGLLLSQGGEFAFVAFSMAKAIGILEPRVSKLLLTTVALTMALTPGLYELGKWGGQKLESKSGFSHYVGSDNEGQIIKDEAKDDFVVVCGYGRIGKMVCELLDKKFIPYIAFDIDPAKVIEARNRGLPVFFGDVGRPEVLKSFHVENARAAVVTTNDKSATNRAVMTLRKLYSDLNIYARAIDLSHQKRLTNTVGVTATIPILEEDSFLLSLPFGGRVLQHMGVSDEEVNILLEEIRKKTLSDRFGAESVESTLTEGSNFFSLLGGVSSSRGATTTNEPQLPGGVVTVPPLKEAES